jgi:hypothetical protein
VKFNLIRFTLPPEEPPVPKAVDQPKEGAVQHAAALDKKVF